jgi:hypothetical protein
MTLLPVAEPIRLRRAPDGLAFIPRDTVVGGACANPFCANQSKQEHHIVRRSYSGNRQWVLIDGTPQPNVCGLCVPCHELINRNKARIVWAIDYYQWNHQGEIGPLRLGYDIDLLGEAPASGVPTLTDGHPDASGSFPEQAAAPVRPATPPSLAEVIPVVASAPHLHPGEKCPTCERKVPHPRKESSPTSKTRAYRLPVDENTSHEDVYAAAAEYVGAKGKPFEQFKVYTIALAALLQDESWRGFYDREADAA